MPQSISASEAEPPLPSSDYPEGDALIRSFRRVVTRSGGRESVAGRSAQGRELLRFDLGTPGKPVVLLTALMHGIEVVGSVALLHLLDGLARDAASGGRLLKEGHYVVMPVVNPDAFFVNMAKFARGDRAWQRCNGNGVDLNRNFPRLAPTSAYQPFSGSRFRLSPHYQGAHEFSEPESRAVRAVALETRPRLSLAFHSFGNLILYPWAYTAQENPRANEYRGLAHEMAQQLLRFPYRTRQARQLYSVIGDMDDWLDAELGALAFTIEVGRSGASMKRPLELLNPFVWMNPKAPGDVAADLTPGALALTAAALGLTPLERRLHPQEVAPVPLNLAAK